MRPRQRSNRFEHSHSGLRQKEGGELLGFCSSWDLVYGDQLSGISLSGNQGSGYQYISKSGIRVLGIWNSYSSLLYYFLISYSLLTDHCIWLIDGFEFKNIIASIMTNYVKIKLTFSNLGYIDFSGKDSLTVP